MRKFVLASIIFSFLIFSTTTYASLGLTVDSVTSTGAINLNPTSQPVTVNGDLTITGTCTGCGGSGSPAAPANSIQFNNAGSFGGSSELTWGGINGGLVSEPTTLVAPNDYLTAVAGFPHLSSGVNNSVIAGDFESFTTGTDNYATDIGVLVYISHDGSGTLQYSRGIEIDADTGLGAGVIADYVGLSIQDQSTLNATVNQAINYADKFIVDSAGGLTSTQTYTGTAVRSTNELASTWTPSSDTLATYSNFSSTITTEGSSDYVNLHAGQFAVFAHSTGNANTMQGVNTYVENTQNVAIAKMKGAVFEPASYDGTVGTMTGVEIVMDDSVGGATITTAYGLLISDMSGLTATTNQAINYADKFIVDSEGATTVKSVKTTPITVSSLPTCNSGAKGTHAFVTDATATTFYSTVAGGGANNVPVFCDGTDWKIGG